MARLFTPVRLLAAGVVLLAVVAILYIAPSDQYIFLPVKAQAVAPYVDVHGERPDGDGGGIYYVAVEVRKASVFEKLSNGGLHDGATLVPTDQVRAPGESESQRRKVGLQQMAESQDIAPIVALRELGYDVDAGSPGTLIADVAPKGPSAGKLQARDLVVRVDGKPSPSPVDLRRLIGRHRPGEQVTLTVRRGDRLRMVSVKTVADPDRPSHPLIGVYPSCAPQRTGQALPVPVRIDVGQVGGPSAGLAFALDIAEELGRDVDHGHKVAATGALCVDGTVVQVGGLKQKTIGARRAGADIFLVPVGENTKVARRYAGSMRIVPVQSFRQALRVLATLPETGAGT